ncbi:envelope-like protein [Cucumis melo var. makuwa]|uniref:Envelope-like protein n=1 Tax=Cucumis melo var. makuwa TaxID=1194695 RepID=A0A5D3DKE1_CUCMM|nr:envelope-like protein [Cucumis melo var. makuwa]TYK24054.1 envelope-like protein [Cucumis melo var. makuwa]
MVKSTKDELAAQISSPSVQKVRGQRFKSTPPQRLYRLPSKKSQAKVSNKLPKQIIDFSYPPTLGTYAPNISETPLSDMDLDDLDDVPLAQLLKKTNVLEVTVEMPASPSMSVHSQESSSTEGVFVPTSGIRHTSNFQPGQLVHSSPSASLPFEPDVAHASVLGNISVVPEGRTDVRSDENEVDPPNLDIRFEEVLTNFDDNLTVPLGSPKIPVAPKLAKRKSQQN